MKTIPIKSGQRFKAIIALLILVLIASATTYGLKKTRRLNVVLVTLDTTRADHLGTYGYQQGLTSSFDDFASQGVVFDRAYAPAPITLASHTSMLTGLYPPEHGLRLNGNSRLRDEIPLLPQILKKHGYDTGAFIAAFVLDSIFGLERGFDTYDDDLSIGTTRAIDSHEVRRSAEQIVDSAISWIAGHTSRPFFCWVHLYDAHAPYDMRPALFDDKFEQNPYDAGIAVELQQFDRLIKFLKESKLDKNTLIVVAGDHGEGLDDHMEIEHGMLVYNSTLHVPLVFAGPDICRPGTRVTQAVSLVDLTPTLLDALKIPPPKQISGRSLLAALKGDAISPIACYAEAETPYYQNRWYPPRTVISDHWKYIESPRPELYDMQNDPGELTNLVETAVDDAEQMRSILELMREQFDEHGAQRVRLSQKQQANLETLGYVATDRFDPKAEGSADQGLPDVKDMLPFLAKYEAAREMSAQGKNNDAIELLEELVQERNDYVGAFVLLGDYLLRERRLNEAIEAYRSARRLAPDSIGFGLVLADCLVERGWYMDAESELRNVVKQEPEAALPHYKLGQILNALGQFNEAIAQFRDSLRIAPDFAAANVRVGEILTRLDRFDEAIDCYKAAIESDSQNVEARAALLTLLVRTGKNETAYQFAKKAVDIDPKSFDYRLQLGSVLVSLNRHREAIGQFREAQRLRPDDPVPPQLIKQAEAALATNDSK